MGFLIHTGQPMQVGDQLIQKVQAGCAAENADHRHRKGKLSSQFQGGDDQSDHRCSQHDTGGEGQHDIAEPMGDLSKAEAENCTCHRCAAHSQGGQ